MSTEENKALMRRICEETMNQGGSWETYHAVDRVLHRPWDSPPGAVSNFHAEIQDQIAQGDKVATRWRATFTHSGDFRTTWGTVVPPSGRQITLTWLSIDRIADGKVVESWVEGDWSGVLRQIGAIPTPAGASV
jgi:predicted ester cyclase